MSFGAPQWFLALAGVLFLALLSLWAHFRSAAQIKKLVAHRLVQDLAGSVSLSRRVARIVLASLAMALVVFSLALPRTGWLELPLQTLGRDIMLVVDVSRSMLAPDTPPNRLERAKFFCRDLIDLLPSDRFGIVAFAGSAFVQAPLTLDKAALAMTLDELSPDIIPKGSTNIAGAIKTALDAFTSAEGVERAIVLVSDGENLLSDPLAAAKAAANANVKIFTVGVGTHEGSLIPIKDEFGRTSYLRSPDGRQVVTRLDEEALRQIAEVTSGFYVPLSPDAAQKVADNGIKTIATREIQDGGLRIPKEAYQPFAATALALAFLWFVMSERRRAPRPPVPQSFKTLAVSTASVLLLFSNPHKAQAAPIQKAFEDFQSGNYAAAQDAFASHARSGHQRARAAYNAGVAAYKAAQFEQAVQWFSQALRDGDAEVQARALYNLGNALARLAEKKDSRDSKKPLLEEALKKYASVPENHHLHPPAEENSEIIKRYLEELQNQQPPPPQSQQNQTPPPSSNPQHQPQEQPQQQQQQQQAQPHPSPQDQNPPAPNPEHPQPGQPSSSGQEQNHPPSETPPQQPQQNQQQTPTAQSPPSNEPSSEPSPDPPKEPSAKSSLPTNPTRSPLESSGSPSGPEESALPPPPAPESTPEPKQGELELAAQQPNPTAQESSALDEQPPSDGRMTAAQARALLESLRDEEQRVRLIQRARQEEVLKDW